jgi:AcrR family transcriptional regulator
MTEGLRERKKQMTRQVLLDAATRLFEERGYDNVTVAEIADAANISVKTMFTYFASKEDLAFGDEAVLRNALVRAVAGRPAGMTVLDAVAGELRSQVAGAPAADYPSAVEGFHRGFGDSPALQNRLRRMWSDYEDAIAAAALAASPRMRPATARLEAMRAMVLVRGTATEEVRDLVLAARDPQAAMQTWLRGAARSLAGDA